MASVTALSSLGWAHYTLYEALPRIAARGFKRAEIASFDDYCFHFNCGSPTPPELKAMLADLGLSPVGLNYYTSIGPAWEPENIGRVVEAWTRKIRQAAEVGIPQMTVSLGSRNDRDDQEYQRSNAIEAYNRVGEAAAGYGVKMLIETPHLFGIMPTAEDALWVVDRLESANVGFLVDCSHWGIIGYDIDEYFSRLGDRLWHIHLRDSSGPDTNDFKQDLELTPGKGTADFRKFGEALDRAGYKGDVSIELEYRDMTLDAIEREFGQGLKHLADNGWQLPYGVKAG